ncbi:hypothetical protein [Kamptonema sp. UHCC 0994]|uniref:hypothetical protein n=1 Tax=Kamptonema sp. UHCC 0994 TaxID=3031329 RepID=UPI0023B9A129|nr:hypothetical protein [Kamptonema sp. UHCC 0994]MDF0552824.1 hypothetical protein [Kamptonema sp. UHCC 0994]
MGKEGKSGAKTDDIDAFAIACWYFDKSDKDYLNIRVSANCLKSCAMPQINNPQNWCVYGLLI